MIKRMAPDNPKITPRTFILLNRTPNTLTPTNKAKSGVSPLIAPAKELDIRVCASENKKAGTAIPKKPLIIKYLISVLTKPKDHHLTKGRRTIPEKTIRIAAT